MYVCPKSKPRSCAARLGLRLHFPHLWVLACASIIGCFWLVSALPLAAAIGLVSVQVDPVNGNDADCNVTLICQTIAYAVQSGASQVNLISGVFNETTVDISNVESVVISGAPSATFFDCSRRLGQTSGAAFSISNSTVTFTGITFQNCSNIKGNGGALSAIDSSVVVSQCRFINCSAANGGALSASGPSRGLFLHVRNSNFTHNTAVGGLIGCPRGSRSSEPCSAWGGAVAAFDVVNVSVTGCKIASSHAVAAVPVGSPQHSKSQNAIAGGGCVSVLFPGNSSGSSLHFSGNTFFKCTVDVSSSRNVKIGNGNVHCRLITSSCIDVCCANVTDDQDTAARCRCTLACRRGCSCWTSHHSASC
jgi:hypothetical protein